MGSGEWYTGTNVQLSTRGNAMAFIATPNAALVVMEWGSETIQWTNTLWYTKPEYTYEDMENLSQAHLESIDAPFLNHINVAWALQQITVYDMREDGGPVYTYAPIDVEGTGTGGAMPAQVAMVLTTRTARRGRSGRGRIFVGGLDEDAIVGGVVDNVPALSVLGVFNAIMEAADGLGWTFVVRSGQQGGVILSTPQTYPVTDIVSRDRSMGTQRRRSDRG